MDNYTKYLEEGTNRLLEVLSQMDMDKEATEAIISAYTEELYSGVCNDDNMPDYEPLIYGVVLTHTDNQLTKALSSQTLSTDEADKAISLCDKEESVLKLFGEKGWKLPKLSNDAIEQCRDLIYKRKESTSIKAKLVDEDNRINDLIKQAESNLDLSMCSAIEEILSEFEKDVAICQQKNIDLPDISNVDTLKTRRRIDDIKKSAAEKDILYKKIIDGDSNIDNAVTPLISSGTDCQGLITMCQNQQQLIEECGAKGWPVPSVKYSQPKTMVSMYSHYQEMIKIDGALASQIDALTTVKQYKDFFSNCEQQKKNVEICNSNGWKIPRLSMGDPGALLDRIHVEKRRKDIAKSIKQKLIGVAVIVILIITVVSFCIIKYREGKIQIPVSASYAVELDYKELKEKFEDAGFENIRIVADEAGWEVGGTVIAVSINGKKSFNKDAYVKPDTLVEIRYSSLDREDISQYLENWQKREYGVLETVLQNNKFSRISLNPIDTSDLAQNKKVCGLKINGQAYSAGRCYIPLNAPIVIEYYKLKITPGKAAKDYTSNDVQYYPIVVELKALGFTNIKVYRKNDLINGWLTEEGSVDSISIAGNGSFTKSDSFYYDDEIIILVHTFKGKGCEDITLIAQ